MKQDYKFIKQILLTMEKEPNFNIENFYLLEKLEIKRFSDAEDKFIGHILLLGDAGVIDHNHPNYDYGIFSDANLSAHLDKCYYRITTKGYEFLDILKNDTAFNKVKDFAISNAIDIGKQIVVNLACAAITG